MPLLHFYGRFNFQAPTYNNDPTEQEIPFDPNVEKEKVLEYCGCDPSHYFEFSFRNVTVNQVTYDDGSIALEGDSIVGQNVILIGFLPDVSPSAVCGQLFGGKVKIGNLLSGTLRKSMQSPLRLNIRPIVYSRGQCQGAHFRTQLDITSRQLASESRYIHELNKISSVEFCFHVNRYNFWKTKDQPIEDRLNGDVYGYIRQIEPGTDKSGLRIKGRRIIAHPDMKVGSEVEKVFIASSSFPEGLSPETEIEGTYDILKDGQLIALHYLDFIPIIDRKNRQTPSDEGGNVEGYELTFTNVDNESIKVGSFKGDHIETQHNGGTVVFQIPEGLSIRDDLMLVVKVKMKNGNVEPLMIESDLDLVLESERGLTVGSKQTGDVRAQVFYKNRPLSGQKVRLRTSSYMDNPFSPIVAYFEEGELVTGDDGKIKATVRTVDLENSPVIYDPVTKHYLMGVLPWDRYYGNYVYLEIDNALRRTYPDPIEQIQIPVRVLHTITPDVIKSTDINFRHHIFPQLFKYYVRYFPWLHVIDNGNNYEQFLNLQDYDSVRSNIDEMINRLDMKDDELNKMPRSRDFPVDGVELLRLWREKGLEE
jgi:hypothetical protein